MNEEETKRNCCAVENTESVELVGRMTVLVNAAPEHVEELRRIALTPEVSDWWGLEALAPTWPFDDPEAVVFAILVEDLVRGLVQYSEEDTPMFRHASMDIFVDPEMHGQGIARDALQTLAKHLIDDIDHHRITIDPAAANEAAIRCYSSIGFRPVGILRQYENVHLDGHWKDGLMMDLIADELVR